MTTTNSSPRWYDKIGLVSFLFFFCFPVGIYGIWKSSKISKGWKIGISATSFLLFIIAVSGSEDTKTKVNPEAVKSSTEPTLNEKTEASLFKTPNNFKEAFNDYSTSNNLTLIIEDIDVQDGEVQNTFQYMFNNNLGILGTINKSDGSVREITMLGTGDGTAISGGNIILCMIGIIASVDPNIEPSKRADILKELKVVGSDVDITNLSTKTEHNDFKYFFNSNPSMGIMFGASRK